jgi:hypothetical protein
MRCASRLSLPDQKCDHSKLSRLVAVFQLRVENKPSHFGSASARQRVMLAHAQRKEEDPPLTHPTLTHQT